MRVYFVGSHATGKTTLCRYVSRHYGLPMITEVARAVLAEMESSLDALRTDMDLVAEYQERVFARQVTVERQHAGRFVSDRAFDNLAYAAEHTTVVAEMMGDQRFADYMRWVSSGTVFFLRPHPSLLKEDGVRAGVSWESVLRIDGMIKLLLELHRVPYLPIESVSMQERVRAVDFVLSRAGIHQIMTTRRPLPAMPAAPAVEPVERPVAVEAKVENCAGAAGRACRGGAAGGPRAASRPGAPGPDRAPGLRSAPGERDIVGQRLGFSGEAMTTAPDHPPASPGDDTDIVALRTSLAVDPADPRAAATLVDKLLAAGRIAEAADVLEAELAELTRRDAPAEPKRRSGRGTGAHPAAPDATARAERHRRAAQLGEQLGRVDRALYHWQQAWKLEPQRTDALEAARAIYASLGDDAMVGRLYEAELGVLGDRGPAPRRAALLLELGKLAFRRGDALAAVTSLEQALALDKDSISAREALADVYSSPAWATATGDDAAEAARGARRAGELFVELGRRRLKERDDTTGIGFLRRALGADPYSRTSSEALEKALTETQRFEELERVLRHREATAEDDRERLQLLGRRIALYEGPLADRPALMEALGEVAAREGARGPAGLKLRGLLREEQRWPELVARLEIDVELLADDALAQVTEVLELATVIREHLGDKDRSAELLHRALSIDPGSEEALARYAEHFRERRDWRGLADLYDFALDTARDQGAPVEEQIRRLEEIAQIAELRLHDAARAIDAWQRIDELEPGSPKAREALRRLGSRAKMWEQLVTVLEAEAQQARSSGERADALRRIAQTYRERQVEPRRAIALFEEVVELSPDDDGALKALGELYEREGDDAGMARTMRRQLELEARRLGDADPERGAREWPVNRRVERLTMLRRLAQMCEARLNDADGVVYACAGVLELLPGDRDALDRMERVLEKTGDQARLEQTLEYHAASASGPAERARVLRRLARLAADAGDDARALDRWEQTLKAVPTDVEALEALASLYDRAQRWGELAAVLERLDGSRPAVQPGTGAAALRVRELERYARVVDERLGDGQRGARAWQRVLELSPRDRSALDALARLHRAAARWRDLADVLAAQLPLHEVDDPARAAQIALERAELLEERLGAPVEAVKQLERVIAELDPRNLDAHSALRRLHEARGDVEAAVRIAERELFLTDEPRQKIARGLEIGILCRDRLGDPVRALGAFQRVLALDPDDDEALAAAADLHARLADWRAHVQVLEKRLTLAEGARERRGLMLAIAQATAERLGDARGGFRWLRRAHEETPDAATLDELRRAAEAFGLWRELSEVYADERTRLVSQGGGVPADVAAYFAASRELATLAERRLGDRGRALEALRDALEIVPRQESLLAECERIAAEADERPLWRALLTSYEAVLKRSTPAGRVTLHEKRARLLDERLGDAKAGVAELMAAFAWAPERVEIRAALERVADKAKAWPEVVAIDTALIERAPTDAARVALLRRKAQVIEERLGDAPRAFRTHLLGFFLAPDDEQTNQALWQLARAIGKYAEADRAPKPEPAGATIHPERVHTAALAEGQAAGPVQRGARARTEDLIAEVARGASADAGDHGDVDIDGDLSVGDTTQPIDLDDFLSERAATQAGEVATVPDQPVIESSSSKRRADATMELSADDLASLVVPAAPRSSAPRGLPGVAPHAPDPHELARGPGAAPAVPLAGTSSGPGKRPPPPPRRTAPPASPPARIATPAPRKAQAQVRRTPLPALPARAYASPWEELATACQLLPASDAAGRLRWLFRAAEIWETGAGDVARAFDTLSRAMLLAAQSPAGDSEARARLHRLAGEHDEWDRLADLYLELADGASTVETAIDLLLEVAAIRARQDRPQEAEVQYRRVLGMRPADEVARGRLEALYRAGERWVDLAASLEERTDPRLGIAAPEAERPALLRELAALYVDRLTRPHDAIDALERLRLMAPDDVDVLIGLGELYARVGRWSKVIEALSRVGDVADGTPAAREALRRIAEIYAQELELPDRAMDAYAQLVAQWSDDEAAYEALDALYQAHARWADLAEVLRRRAALAKVPDRRAELLARRAGVLLEWLGQAEEAAAALRHARTIQPDDPRLADLLVTALIAAQRGREASAVLEGRIERARSLTPEERGGGAGELAALWIRLGQLRLDELDDPKAARAALEQALALVPDHPNALAALARLHRPDDDPAAFADAKLREADTATDDDNRIDALMAAGEVLRDRLDDPARARRVRAGAGAAAVPRRRHLGAGRAGRARRRRRRGRPPARDPADGHRDAGRREGPRPHPAGRAGPQRRGRDGRRAAADRGAGRVGRPRPGADRAGRSARRRRPLGRAGALHQGDPRRSRDQDRRGFAVGGGRAAPPPRRRVREAGPRGGRLPDPARRRPPAPRPPAGQARARREPLQGAALARGRAAPGRARRARRGAAPPGRGRAGPVPRRARRDSQPAAREGAGPVRARARAQGQLRPRAAGDGRDRDGARRSPARRRSADPPGHRHRGPRRADAPVRGAGRHGADAAARRGAREGLLRRRGRRGAAARGPAPAAAREAARAPGPGRRSPRRGPHRRADERVRRQRQRARRAPGPRRR